jgi:hypothetical protein
MSVVKNRNCKDRCRAYRDTKDRVESCVACKSSGRSTLPSSKDRRLYSFKKELLLLELVGRDLGTDK